jgi:hypothetical protein
MVTLAFDSPLHPGTCGEDTHGITKNGTYAPQLQKEILRNFIPGQQACILGQRVSSSYGLLRVTVKKLGLHKASTATVGNSGLTELSIIFQKRYQ